MHHYPIVSDRKVRFALVGCGRIAQNHFAAMENHADRCEVADVRDIDRAALCDAVNKTGALGHNKLSELLASTTADCVVLTTPSGLHAAQATEIAQAGKHVMTE
jgi:UDP-N-acetyl-2-amino-2-deoxyglucuronate dehydrogenase